MLTKSCHAAVGPKADRLSLLFLIEISCVFEDGLGWQSEAVEEGLIHRDVQAVELGEVLLVGVPAHAPRLQGKLRVIAFELAGE